MCFQIAVKINCKSHPIILERNTHAQEKTALLRPKRLRLINNQVDDGFKCLEKWGFKYQTMITWHKMGNPGIGWYFRGTSESCLFGTVGKLPYKKINGRFQQGVTSFVAPRLEHSVKPELMRWMIERVSYPPYCEIFARRFVPNWTCVGNEINVTIIS